MGEDLKPERGESVFARLRRRFRHANPETNQTPAEFPDRESFTEGAKGVSVTTSSNRNIPPLTPEAIEKVNNLRRPPVPETRKALEPPTIAVDASTALSAETKEFLKRLSVPEVRTFDKQLEDLEEAAGYVPGKADFSTTATARADAAANPPPPVAPVEGTDAYVITVTAEPDKQPVPPVTAIEPQPIIEVVIAAIPTPEPIGELALDLTIPEPTPEVIPQPHHKVAAAKPKTPPTTPHALPVDSIKFWSELAASILAADREEKKVKEHVEEIASYIQRTKSSVSFSADVSSLQTAHDSIEYVLKSLARAGGDDPVIKQVIADARGHANDLLEKINALRAQRREDKSAGPRQTEIVS